MKGSPAFIGLNVETSIVKIHCFQRYLIPLVQVKHPFPVASLLTIIALRFRTAQTASADRKSG